MKNPQNTVITGSAGLLAGHLAISFLQESETVFCALNRLDFDRFTKLLRRLAAEIKSGNEKVEILHKIEKQLKQTDWSEISGDTEVWFFDDCAAQNEKQTVFSDSANLKLPDKINITSFNYVLTPYSGGGDWHWITKPAAYSEDFVLPALPEFPATRVFTTSLTVSETAPVDAAREGFLFFPGALFDLKTEIEERLPEYFEYRSLRCFAPENASVNLIYARKAAEMMRAIAKNSSGGNFRIASPTETSFSDILEKIGFTYELSLLAEEDREFFNAIDNLFEMRLCGFHKQLISQPVDEIEKSCETAGIAPESLIIDEREQERLFQKIRENQEQERENLLERVAAFPENFLRKEINRKDHPLVYYSTGDGEKTIVLINALGQGSHYWLRLIENLRQRYKVLFWDLRGVLEPLADFGIIGHAEDLEAILENEKVAEYHIAAWCTGPKIAVEHCLRNPQAVRSMVFLNTTVKCLTSPAELDTAYEKNFEPLCKILIERPVMAGSIMNSLKMSVGDELDLSDDTGEEDISLSVLAMMNRDMRNHVNRPFSAPDVLINYSGQALDFWKYDFREKAADVSVPALFICSEHDRVATPQASEFCADLFPNAKLLHIPGATHYFLYDRPETTAGIIETFFENDAETKDWTDVIN